MNFFKKTLGAAVVAGAALGAQAGQENFGVENYTATPQTSAEQQAEYQRMNAKFNSVKDELRKINYLVVGDVTPANYTQNNYISYLKNTSSITILQNNEKIFTEPITKDINPADFAMQLQNKIKKIESYTVKPFSSDAILKTLHESFEETAKKRAEEEGKRVIKSFELVKLVSEDMGLNKNWSITFNNKNINDQGMPILGEVLITNKVTGVAVARDLRIQTNLIDLARTLSGVTKNIDMESAGK